MATYASAAGGRFSPLAGSSRGLAGADRDPGDAPVVVADTNHASRAVFAMLLQRAGYPVVEADRGEEVIRLAHAARPRAIVMTTMLGGVSGLRALEVLKDDPVTAWIPVVVTSSTCSEDHEHRVRVAGCAAYLLKPCPPRRLLAEVEAVAQVPRVGHPCTYEEGERSSPHGLCDGRWMLLEPGDPPVRAGRHAATAATGGR